MVPEYENDHQWLRYLESERLRIRREMMSGDLSVSRLREMDAEVEDIDQQMNIVKARIRADQKSDVKAG
jgi:hypothetical protein